jgi:hypothetical protein
MIVWHCVGGRVTSGVWEARLAEVAVAHDQRIENPSGLATRCTVFRASPRRRDLPPLL